MIHTALVLAAGALVSGCSLVDALRGGDGADGGGHAGVPARISVVTGDGQSGMVGVQLVAPFVVAVVDGGDLPVAGIAVTFAIDSGGGAVDTPSTMTTADGRAQATLTLGPDPGPTDVIAHASGVTGSEARFTALALHDGATRIAIVSGDDQSGVAGLALPAPLVVAVANANAAPVAGYTVSFVALGGGSVAPSSALTNAQGLAQTTLTLGAATGPAVVHAIAPGLLGAPIVFDAVALAGPASVLAGISGSAQQGPPGAVLAMPLVVAVSDAHGNPVAGRAVDFVVTAGGGSVAPANAITNAQGRAETVLTLGGAGASSVEARAPGLAGSPVVFAAEAVTGGAMQIAAVSGSNQSATAGSVLAAPFVARVTDGSGNPVPGFTVNFVVTAGGGSVSAPSAMTDAQGQVRTTLTLGAVAGANRVEARASLFGSPVVFAAIGGAGPAASIAATSGAGQVGTPGNSLAAPITVTVRDANANPVAGVTVNFVVTAGGGSRSPASSVTNAAGQAQATWTLGTAGANTLEARAPGLAGSPVTLSALALAYTAADVATGEDPSAIALADLDGDGRPDIATVHHGIGTATFAALLDTTPAGAATASFAPRADVTTNPFGRSIALADFDGDGRPDVVTAHENGTALAVHRNTTSLGGPASFGEKVDHPSGSFTIAVATGDFNIDGKPDLVAGHGAANAVSVLLDTTPMGGLTPTFAAKADFAIAAPSSAIAIGDVNGDGKPDIIAGTPGNAVSVLLDTTPAGSPIPSFATKVDFTAGDTASIVVVDLDGDARPDIAVANRAGNTVSILRNTTPAGALVPSFAARTTLAIGAAPSGLAAADVDGDGRLDLITANETADTLSILINRGTGFLPKIDVATASAPVAVGAGDFNLDGKPDLAIACVGADAVRILLAR